jgi:hypothetical protein
VILFRDHAASPDAAASIASRAQRVVTIAKRPSGGLGMHWYTSDLRNCQDVILIFGSKSAWRRSVALSGIADKVSVYEIS